MRWATSSMVAGCLAVAVTACLGDGDEMEPDDPGDAPHSCLGAALEVRFEAGVDPTGFADLVRTEISEVEIECNTRSFGYLLVSCIPSGQSCGFESPTDASAYELEFRSAIAQFDPALADYPYAVIDDCFCRVY